MNEFEPLVFYRREVVDGVSPWLWIQGDRGGWDGPSKDWQNEHKHNVLKYCKKFDNVIQAGGNQGIYPRLYSEMFKNVYTFEPDPLNYHCLVHNCQKDNIHTFNAALGAEHDMCSVMRVSMENTGMHCTTMEPTMQHTVPVLKIDDFVFPTLDLIHLDTEGYEAKIISGGLETIQKHKPMILCERGDTPRIMECLTKMGYTYHGNSGLDAIFSVT